MFSAEKKEKEESGNSSSKETSNSCWSGSDRKRKEENGREEKNKEPDPIKFGHSIRNDLAKSFKSTRKKEGFPVSQISKDRISGFQVPSSDSDRGSQRRDGKKTDFKTAENHDGRKIPGIFQGSDITSGSREPILVRETRTSRLRAASRTSETDSYSLKSTSGDVKKIPREKSSSSGSPSRNSFDKKSIDKSRTRKSHLNRSHTCEGVHEDIYSPGGSIIGRRRGKNRIPEVSRVKSDSEKSDFSLPAKSKNPAGIANPFRSSSGLSRDSHDSNEKFSHFLENGAGKAEAVGKSEGEDGKSNDVSSSENVAVRSRYKSSGELRNESISGNDKCDSVDVATKAEMLAATTLKMIDRLDEINRKSKGSRGSRSGFGSGNESDKKTSPSGSSITRDRKLCDFGQDDAEVAKCGNGPAVIRSVRTCVDPVSGPSARIKSESWKPSILKKKMATAGTAASDSDKSKPISILKRKSLSQEDSQSIVSSPVTFSPSALKKENRPRKQGILKKRRSLDENEVRGKRSDSPENFKSILKNERRCSMEELATRRSHSPDSAVQVQGILKRKPSKEEEGEEGPTCGSTQIEPQGILKRNSGQQRVKIVDGVAVPPGIGEMQTAENVRPILKKKSSSEEHGASDSSLGEIPKSILKKKSSLESEEAEEKPKKPILKTGRTSSSSLEEPEDVAGRGKNLASEKSSETESVKPILKKDKEISDEFVVSVSSDRIKHGARRGRSRSSSSPDGKSKASIWRRRSSESEPSNGEGWGLRTELTNANFTVDLSKEPTNESDEPGVNRSNHLHPSLSIPSDSTSGNPAEDCESKKGRRSTDEENCPFSAVVSISSSANSCRIDDEDEFGSVESRFDKEKGLTDRLFEKNSFCSSTDSDPISVFESIGKGSDEKSEEECRTTTDSCCERISAIDSNESIFGGRRLEMGRKGESSRAKVTEEKSDGEEENVRKMPKGNRSFLRRSQEKKKFLDGRSQRFSTQPISSEELELAAESVRKSGSSEAEKHEDEFSTLSYLERLRLFESSSLGRGKISSEMAGSKIRESRYRTQPVTISELETAKSRRYSRTKSNENTVEESEEEKNTSGKEKLTEIPNRGIDENRQKPRGILKNSYEIEKGKDQGQVKVESDSDSSDEGKEDDRKKKSIEFVSGSKEIPKQSFPAKKMDESVKGKRRGGGLGENLAAILQKVERISRGENSDEEKDGGIAGKMKCIKNEGISRRFVSSRNNSSIVKSQSHSAVSSAFHHPGSNSSDDSSESKGRSDPFEKHRRGIDETDEKGFGGMAAGLKRSTTQPFGSSDGSADDDMSGATIQERLARLKKSGELNWQKRKSQVTSVENELSVITAGNYLFKENCLIRSEKSSLEGSKEGEDSRNSILADRLGKLDAAKEGWKKRVRPSDAIRFSIEGKMLEKRDSSSPPRTVVPSVKKSGRQKRSPKAVRFRSKQTEGTVAPSSPAERFADPIARAFGATAGGKDGLFGSSLPNGPIVTVPKNDDETFTSFFNGIRGERIFGERLEIKDEDLDVVTEMKSSQLLVQKKNVQVHKRRATVRNPLKSLATRLESQAYTEIKTGIAEMELKRMKMEKGLKNSNLAIEALAGLASQEDFTAITLKKASEGAGPPPDAPYKDLMLLQVKGRRHVQTRLIEPSARNVNAGDCFILVTPKRLFHYVGEFANVIERSRGAEIAMHIQQNGDLGCGADSVIGVGAAETGRATRDQTKEFWDLLGGETGCERKAGDLDEDEVFESCLVDTNMVYELVDDELVPDETYWGSIPKIDILDPNKILVFDFGSEFYVWNGKNVNLSKRRVAMKLARELWEEGFDYTDCAVCPLTAASHVGAADSDSGSIADLDKAGPVRPPWALFAKITQNVETVLFREKFLDWPDHLRVARRNERKKENGEVDATPGLDLKACDPKRMMENVLPEADLVLEGSHLGRGIEHFDEDTKRRSEITTKNVTVWHVSEYEYSEVPSKSAGQFHMEDSYVVRWQYVVTVTGRELSGQPSKHFTTGRDRHAYFYWQGRDSPVNDKGAVACLTVELDKERGPQVRVVQGSEPPAFRNLFGGRMVVHEGRRFSESSRGTWRLFACRGETESESALFEVPCSARQLRSAASYVLANASDGTLMVWHGWKSCEHTRKVALGAAERIRARPPDEFAFVESSEISLSEETEGSESDRFLGIFGPDNRKLYFSLMEEETCQVKTPRLFHLTSVSGEFHFSEMASAYLGEDKSKATPFPFLQSDLYSASQPSLFLLDSTSGLWLWQGWWMDDPEGAGGNLRFQAERRAAMETAILYSNLKFGDSSCRAKLVWAGLEPLIFTNQFPFWTDRDDVAEINMKDGKKPGEMVLVKTELDSITQSFYPLSQLQNRPLPEGVNPTSLEEYLKPECFQELFGLEREEFLKMPSWKKKKLKQEAGLF